MADRQDVVVVTAALVDWAAFDARLRESGWAPGEVEKFHQVWSAPGQGSNTDHWAVQRDVLAFVDAGLSAKTVLAVLGDMHEVKQVPGARLARPGDGSVVETGSAPTWIITRRPGLQRFRQDHVQELVVAGWAAQEIVDFGSSWRRMAQNALIDLARFATSLRDEGQAGSVRQAQRWLHALYEPEGPLPKRKPWFPGPGDGPSNADFVCVTVRAYLDATGGDDELALACAEARLGHAEAADLHARGDLSLDRVRLLAALLAPGGS